MALAKSTYSACTDFFYLSINTQKALRLRYIHIKNIPKQRQLYTYNVSYVTPTLRHTMIYFVFSYFLKNFRELFFFFQINGRNNN